MSSPTIVPDDPYLWLENILETASIDWVKARNESTQSRLQSDERYPALKNELGAILMAKDRIPYVTRMGEFYYNLWQDAEHVQGLWRRTSLDEYSRQDTQWETVLDLDQLSKREGKTWVFRGAKSLAPAHTRCLLSLSDAGKDAVRVREFDLELCTFVSDGFELLEAITRVVWLNANEVLVATDFGEGTMTESGRPRQVKRWRRGQPLSAAHLVFEGASTELQVRPYTSWVEGRLLVFVIRELDFYTCEFHQLDIEGETEGQLKKLDLPTDLPIQAVLDGFVVVNGFVLVVRLSSWDLGDGRNVPAGTVVAVPLSGQGPKEIVWTPAPNTGLMGVWRTRGYAILKVIEDGTTRMYQARRHSAAKWEVILIPIPTKGTHWIVSSSTDDDRVLFEYQDFFTPNTVYSLDLERPSQTVKAVKALPECFDASAAKVERHFALAKDGTKIPYFIIHPTSRALGNNTPTILYGYGGYGVSLTPSYLGTIGKTWIEKGGAYVIANIRGGGERGRDWHQAALKEKRQTGFDDFYAVAEDLIARKFTSPEHLGISGASNGGLLMGVAMTQRPELFNAVVCSVPFLDMLRFHKLSAGATWKTEYGDPEIPEERAFIAKYSPYQNIRLGQSYPEVFFTGSTTDDRVHPGHARKMAARLESLGYGYYFYENMEGGHDGAANLQQQIKLEALQMTYFWKKLAVSEPS